MPETARTKDGVEVRPRQTVYHPSYFPTGTVMAEDPTKTVIPGYDIVPTADCYFSPWGMYLAAKRVPR